MELELGGVLLQIKQRLTGMDPKWSEVSFDDRLSRFDSTLTPLSLITLTGCKGFRLMLMEIRCVMQISVLGTSGLAGSYIEKRRLPD